MLMKIPSISDHSPGRSSCASTRRPPPSARLEATMPDAPPGLESIEAMLRGDPKAARDLFDGERDAALRTLSKRDAREVSALHLEACARVEPLVEHFTKMAPPA